MKFGDYVKVVAGRYAGERGRVVHLDFRVPFPIEVRLENWTNPDLGLDHPYCPFFEEELEVINEGG